MSQEKIKYFELIENQNTTDPTVGDASKAVHRRKLRVCNAYI